MPAMHGLQTKWDVRVHGRSHCADEEGICMACFLRIQVCCLPKSFRSLFYAHDQRLLSSWLMLLGCARELTRSNCLMQRRTILVDKFHILVSVKFTIL